MHCANGMKTQNANQNQTMRTWLCAFVSAPFVELLREPINENSFSKKLLEKRIRLIQWGIVQEMFHKI